MTEDTIEIRLPAEGRDSTPRQCHMSLQLFQNARQTMGELRDAFRLTGLSWDAIRILLDNDPARLSPIDKALARMDDYSTGPARSLHDKPSNIPHP